jgi:hypothetical protein
MDKLSKKNLIEKCKQLDIKKYSGKSKPELIDMIHNNELSTIFIDSNPHFNVLKELLLIYPVDKTRKVCKTCYNLGHNTSSPKCPIIIQKHLILTNKIKNKVLSIDCFDDQKIEDYLLILSEELNITPNLCKTLYAKISPIEFINRPMNISLYDKILEELKVNCGDCGKIMFNIKTNTNRIWKNKTVCDGCYSQYNEEIENNWNLIKQYRQIQCAICDVIKINKCERFHYDHLSMFDKTDSICSMINSGVVMEDIYHEIDKCQILCLTCHHKITDIEHRLGFGRIKTGLTRKLNSEEISQEVYDAEMQKNNIIYQNKMRDIYEKLKL